jgi:hypothetical protein
MIRRSQCQEPGRVPKRWRLKQMKFWSVALLLLALIPRQMNGHKVTLDYEVKPISLPGASGVVSLDYFAYDRSTGNCGSLPAIPAT